MYFNFTDLINKYIQPFTLVINTKKGFNNLGEAVYKTKKKELQGAILGLGDSKLYLSAGTLSSSDKLLFMFEELPVQAGAVIFKGNSYKLEKQIENAEYTGVYQYTLKYISAFNGGDTHA